MLLVHLGFVTAALMGSGIHQATTSCTEPQELLSPQLWTLSRMQATPTLMRLDESAPTVI